MKKYPLVIGGAQTSSLTVLTRMANCDDVTLYAEVRANANNEITRIDARLTAAEGKLVEYDKGKKEFTLETPDGSQFKLKTVSNPKQTATIMMRKIWKQQVTVVLL